MTAQTWGCGHCRQTYESPVILRHPPVHSCPSPIARRWRPFMLVEDLIETHPLPASAMTAASLPAHPSVALVETGGTAEGLLAVLSDPSATSQGSAP